MSRKVQNIILVIYIFMFVAFVIGASYAYFSVVKVSTVSPEVEVSSAITNFITFSSGNPIFINPTISNFKEGMGNIVGDTFASAYLRVDGSKKEISVKYALFLDIERNNLTYSTPNKTPELLLQIEDPDGNLVTSIEGLNYVTVIDGDGNPQQGFDITTALGKYYVVKEQVLSTSSEITQKWVAKMIFVNLNDSQNNNFDKELKGYIQIEKVE